MIRLDEEAIICDLAETYHILNYRGLSPSLVAVLCIGLREDSRIKRKIAGRKLTTTETLQAAMLDKLALILWTKTKDARKGSNRPKSVLEALEATKKQSNYKVFDSIEEFEKRRAELIGS